MEQRSFAAGQTIFREGDPSAEAYHILSGEVEISIGTAPDSIVVATLGPGEIFGEMGLVDEKPRSATARALSETKVEVVDEFGFVNEVFSNPGLLGCYLSSLFERLRTTDALLEMHITKAGGPQVDGVLGTAGAGQKATRPASVTLVSDYGATGYTGPPLRLEIDKFPFKIGRAAADPSRESPLHSNDLRVRDDESFQVSRNHCMIERHGAHIVVRDRASSRGTIVNGQPLGTKADYLVAKLQPGSNSLILGTRDSPHQFHLVVRE